MTYIEQLKKLNACTEAVEWCEKNHESLESAWQDCTRGDWMLWLLGRLSGPPETNSRKRLVLCACECARLALPRVPEGEDRPRIAIETAEKWAREEGVLFSDLLAAADAAYTAHAAYAATDAASAAYAAYAAAHTAYADYANSADDAASAARDKSLAQCADIARKHYPDAPMLAKGGTP